MNANRLIKFCDVSLSYGVIEHAKTHEESKGAFLTFQKENTMTRRELDRSSGTASTFSSPTSGSPVLAMTISRRLLFRFVQTLSYGVSKETTGEKEVYVVWIVQEVVHNGRYR